MEEHGILGVRPRKQSAARIRGRKWLKRREIWLVALGIALHAVYMLSIFDIYFKSPIVHGMDPVSPRYTPPAKRLVLLVADGLRADKFFEPDSDGNYRAPFLRSVIRGQGRWGVSHARPPTESRPGHVAIIAGFYEDPSAITKGWKANPVEFDSVFNKSRHIFSYGSPDIVPIFCKALPHSTWNSYPHEFEDFATDASFLDEWSFDQFQSIVNKSKEDSKLKQLFHQDQNVIFLHLLGCDSNGHAHRPFSSIYLSNVKVVDRIAEGVYNLLENYFKDNQTTYIFTADHGMSDKGSHGDGHWSNTDTPLVVWGAGVKHPKPASNNNQNHSERFVDEHDMHDTPTPDDWGLSDIERVDVNQADIAPLMSTLLGLPCPVNSVGSLPLDYIDFNKGNEVEAVLANAKQILNQFLRKSLKKTELPFKLTKKEEVNELDEYDKISNLLDPDAEQQTFGRKSQNWPNLRDENGILLASSFRFKPFEPLAHYTSILDEIESLISNGDYENAMKLSQNLRSLGLDGLHYFQTYDWFMLMTVIVLGYFGWMLCLILHVLQSYTSLPGKILKTEEAVFTREHSSKVYLCGSFIMALIFIVLYLEHSPPLYHAYFAMTVFLWTNIFSEYRFLRAIWKYFLQTIESRHVIELSATCIASIIILELLVRSFIERIIYTWCFLIVGVVSSLFLYRSIPWKSGIPIFLWLACWFLSVFTLMPAEIPDKTVLVSISGLIIVAIGGFSRYLDKHTKDNKFWQYLTNRYSKPKFPFLFHIQACLVGLSSVLVYLSTSHRTEKRELLALHQVMNWSIAGLSMVLPLFSATDLLSRLTSIFLGFAPPFLLLSIGYEAVFYGALGLALFGWISFENALLYVNKPNKSSFEAENGNIILEEGDRCLQLSDMRIPVVFLVFFNIAFFGTGNFASIASFEISSVYRFITIFSPFLMAALLIFKLFIPFMLVICAFSAITKLVKVPRSGCYFLVILCSDVMTIHFFFLVKNTGSWMEIGNSISHFGIVSAQVVFVLLLFALTNVYTKDIQTRSRDQVSQKTV